MGSRLVNVDATVTYTPETWQMMLGGALLLTILFFPGGLWSLFERRRAGAA